MTDHESNTLSKLLIVGDSGSGKTGALSSLVDADYNIRVLDFDNGLSVLKGYVRDKSKLANVHYLTLRDELQLVGGKMVVKKANACQRALEALDKGGDLWGVDSGIPPLQQWTPRDVLVVDSLALMGRSALLMVMQADGAGMKNPEIQHYGAAMEMLERFIGQVTSAAINCNVVVNTHLYTPNNSVRPAPDALGDKLGPKIPKYFDNMISLSITANERTFKTKKDGLLPLKTSIPLKDTYPLSTGLADIFKALQG